MGTLHQVADGVWVRQSEWVWANSVIVRAQDGRLMICVLPVRGLGVPYPRGQ